MYMASGVGHADIPTSQYTDPGHVGMCVTTRALAPCTCNRIIDLLYTKLNE